MSLPMCAHATCADNHTESDCAQNDYDDGACIWDTTSNPPSCTERCPATDQTTCNQTPGCGHNGVECAPCNLYEYNPGGSGATGCKTCATLSSGNWTWDVNETSHPNDSTFDYDNAEYGQSACPWKCDTDYYKNNDGDACLHCPLKPGDAGYNNDNTQYGIIQTHENLNNISQCDCGQHANLIQMDRPILGQQTSPLDVRYDHLYFCGTCGTAKPADINASPRICDQFIQTHSNPAYGEEFDNNGIRIAYKCPDHATYNDDSEQCVCTSTNGAASADMNCNYSNNTDTPCSCNLTCDESKHLVPGSNFYGCYCDYDYYGNDLNGCTRCPTGTVTYDQTNNIHFQGALVINECKMLHGSNTAYDVQFCTSDGNCMDLIPSNATITQPQLQ